jgi:hypothetical protein
MTHGGQSRRQVGVSHALLRAAESGHVNAVRLLLDNAAAASAARTVQAHLFHANIALVDLYLLSDGSPPATIPKSQSCNQPVIR